MRNGEGAATAAAAEDEEHEQKQAARKTLLQLRTKRYAGNHVDVKVVGENKISQS